MQWAGLWLGHRCKAWAHSSSPAKQAAKTLWTWTTTKTFHSLIPKHGRCLKNICLTRLRPLFSTWGRRRGPALPCPALLRRLRFAALALKRLRLPRTSLASLPCGFAVSQAFYLLTLWLQACLFYLTVLLLLSYHPITAPNYSALKSRH